MTMKEAENIKLDPDVYSRCPYCGSDAGYYTKDYAYGPTRFRYHFGGSEADNYTLYDTLNFRKSTYAYCLVCDKRLFRMDDRRGEFDC